jgi:hypothetical protein
MHRPQRPEIICHIALRVSDAVPFKPRASALAQRATGNYIKINALVLLIRHAR